MRMPVLAACCALVTLPAAAETVRYKEGMDLRLLARNLKDGTTVEVAPGYYRDCGIFNANNITIRGVGDKPPVFDEYSCAGKGIFVITGDNYTVENIEFRNAIVDDRNGAGIRAEGQNLTVSNSRFVGNQNGMLVTPRKESGTITIRKSQFIDNGESSGSTHALYVNKVDELRVLNSRFEGTNFGHNIKSRALKTVVRDTVIEDGADGNSSYAIDISNGGAAEIVGNSIQKGPKTDNRSTAIAIAFEGAKNMPGPVRIANNRFRSDVTRRPVHFVINKARQPAVLTGNRFEGDVKPLDGAGSVD